MLTEADLLLPDGRTLHYYDTGGAAEPGRLPVFWHHGTPNIGLPPEPLFAAADRNSIRFVSYDRPSYGGSTPNPGRDIAPGQLDWLDSGCARAELAGIGADRVVNTRPAADLAG